MSLEICKLIMDGHQERKGVNINHKKMATQLLQIDHNIGANKDKPAVFIPSLKDKIKPSVPPKPPRNITNVNENHFQRSALAEEVESGGVVALRKTEFEVSSQSRPGSTTASSRSSRTSIKSRPELPPPPPPPPPPILPPLVTAEQSDNSDDAQLSPRSTESSENSRDCEDQVTGAVKSAASPVLHTPIPEDGGSWSSSSDDDAPVHVRDHVSRCDSSPARFCENLYATGELKSKQLPGSRQWRNYVVVGTPSMDNAVYMSPSSKRQIALEFPEQQNVETDGDIYGRAKLKPVANKRSEEEVAAGGHTLEEVKPMSDDSKTKVVNNESTSKKMEVGKNEEATQNSVQVPLKKVDTSLEQAVFNVKLKSIKKPDDFVRQEEPVVEPEVKEQGPGNLSVKTPTLVESEGLKKTPKDAKTTNNTLFEELQEKLKKQEEKKVLRSLSDEEENGRKPTVIKADKTSTSKQGQKIGLRVQGHSSDSRMSSKASPTLRRQRPVESEDLLATLPPQPKVTPIQNGAVGGPKPASIQALLLASQPSSGRSSPTFFKTDSVIIRGFTPKKLDKRNTWSPNQIRRHAVQQQPHVGAENPKANRQNSPQENLTVKSATKTFQQNLRPQSPASSKSAVSAQSPVRSPKFGARQNSKQRAASHGDARNQEIKSNEVVSKFRESKEDPEKKEPQKQVPTPAVPASEKGVTMKKCMAPPEVIPKGKVSECAKNFSRSVSLGSEVSKVDFFANQNKTSTVIISPSNEEIPSKVASERNIIVTAPTVSININEPSIQAQPTQPAPKPGDNTEATPESKSTKPSNVSVTPICSSPKKPARPSLSKTITVSIPESSEPCTSISVNSSLSPQSDFSVESCPELCAPPPPVRPPRLKKRARSEPEFIKRSSDGDSSCCDQQDLIERTTKALNAKKGRGLIVKRNSVHRRSSRAKSSRVKYIKDRKDKTSLMTLFAEVADENCDGGQELVFEAKQVLRKRASVLSAVAQFESRSSATNGEIEANEGLNQSKSKMQPEDRENVNSELAERKSFLFDICPTGNCQEDLKAKLTGITIQITRDEAKPRKVKLKDIDEGLSSAGSNDTLNSSTTNLETSKSKNQYLSVSLLNEITATLKNESDIELALEDSDDVTDSEAPVTHKLPSLAARRKQVAATLIMSKDFNSSAAARLKRKSSVPNLIPSNGISIDPGHYEEPGSLYRKSWTNQSNSSIGSTTSSSSLGGSSAMLQKALLHVPRGHRLRRRSDVTSSVAKFWQEENELGDNESSPNHSSGEDLSSSGSGKHGDVLRPIIKRKRNMSDILRGAKTLASMMRRDGHVQQQPQNSKRAQQQTPKIEVMFNKSESNTPQHSPRALIEVEPADLEMCEYEPEDFEEKCDAILHSIQSQKARKSFFVARELLSSERTFVEVLQLITVHFPKALDETAKRLKLPGRSAIIPEADLEKVLGGLPVLKEMNHVILKDMYDRVYNWTEETGKIADVFVKKGPFLKHYTYYIKDFEKILKAFDNLVQKHPNFNIALKDFESSKKCQFLGLKAFMLKPVQRMPQYSLLLEDYLRTLEEGHIDYEDTIKAIHIVRSVAEHANEAIRSQLNMERLMSLQARIPDFHVVSDTRVVVKEGQLFKVSASKKEHKLRYFVLMSDTFLGLSYANANHQNGDSQLKLKYTLSLNRLKVVVPPQSGPEFEFNVISRAISFTLIARSERERYEWIESLRTTAKNFMESEGVLEPSDFDVVGSEKQLGRKAPAYVQDSRISMCQSCHYEFKIAFRRHHCRACGQVVCRNCSSNEAPLEYLEYDTGRVCDSCYDVLLSDFERLHSQETVIFSKNRLKFRKMNLITGSSTARIQEKAKHSIRVPTRRERASFIDGDIKITGYLKWRDRKVWKRNWVVLMGRVMYFFEEPEDTVAVMTIPVLGYTVELGYFQEQNQEVQCFKLCHANREDVCFQVENQTMIAKWETALSEATVMSSDKVCQKP